MIPTHRKILDELSPFIPARTLEATRQELGTHQILNLSANENTFGLSPRVKQALLDHWNDLSYYPDSTAAALRRQVADYHQVPPEQLIFGTGSFQLIELVAQTFLSPGDEAIALTPSFPYYYNATRQMEARFVSVPLRDFAIDLDPLKQAINDKTRVIWLCNPNNPAGGIVTEPTLRQFLQSIPRDIVVVLDEAYVDFVDDPNFPDSPRLLDEFGNLVILRTFSKAYGLASFRIGYGIARPELIDLMSRLHLPVNISTPSQLAAAASLADREYYQRVVDGVKAGRELYYRTLEALGLRYIRSHGNFVLFHTGLPNSQPVVDVYYQQGILIRAGEGFGLPGWLRVTIGTPEENRRVLALLPQALVQTEKRRTLQMI